LLLPAPLLRTPALLIAILVSGGALVHGQSLGEAAAKEKERRAKIHRSGESVSDSDLQDAGAKRARGLDYKIRLDVVNIELKAAEERFKDAERQWRMVYMHSVGFPIEQATARLETVRKELARLQQQRDDLEDAARREGIPPGYMR
jgi:hypothetical protein